MTTITAQELNFMVFRYLQESGFLHTAFSFGHEAAIDKETSVEANSVPPGALVTFVQKGIQHLKMEANLKLDGAEADAEEDFSFMKPFDLLNMNANELRAAKELENLIKMGKEIEITERIANNKQKEKIPDNVNYKLNETVTAEGHEPTNMPPSSIPQPRKRPRGILSTDVLTLEGHSAEVFDCAWSPAGLVLASGAGDSTARIWRIADRSNSNSLVNRVAGMRILQHFNPDEEHNGITTLDWNLDGSLLATGSRDGLARIWDTNGEMKCLLVQHKGPIYSIRWNKKSDCLLTGGCDGSAIVWDANTYKQTQQFEFHSGPIMEVDWRTNRTFALGAADKKIYVCKIGENQPVKLFSGHKDEVNCVKWDPSCLLLASGSDDNTAKIWSMEQDMPVHDLKDHDKEIYAVKWSPTGPTTGNPNKQLILATLVYDAL
ncbi:WD40 repeat-containing protein HOS15-like [Bidens hawaiensis]|uniref:WD40 repeat-containing protein HOS15-like n=1 Tax=Bidens hawaiensis TaxID=980011 RepID=UPI00404A3BC5